MTEVTALLERPQRAAVVGTVFVGPDGQVFTVGCNRCGGTGTAP